MDMLSLRCLLEIQVEMSGRQFKGKLGTGDINMGVTGIWMIFKIMGLDEITTETRMMEKRSNPRTVSKSTREKRESCWGKIP